MKEIKNKIIAYLALYQLKKAELRKEEKKIENEIADNIINLFKNNENIH